MAAVDHERTTMIKDLTRFNRFLGAWTVDQEQLEERYWVRPEKAAAALTEWVQRTEPLVEMLEDPASSLLPEVPSPALPFMAEVVQNERGELVATTGVLRPGT